MIPPDYSNWIFRLNVPITTTSKGTVTNDASSPSDDERGSAVEGDILLSCKYNESDYSLSGLKGGQGLRFLAELCPHGVAVYAQAKDSVDFEEQQRISTSDRGNGDECTHTKWSWSFSSQTSPSQWNVTSSNLLSITYRPTHEALPSYTNMSKKREIWNRSVGACFEKGGSACMRMVCGNDSGIGSRKRLSRKKQNHRWKKMKQLITGAPKPIHRIKVTYTVDDIVDMETIVSTFSANDSAPTSTSLVDGETESLETNTGLWIRGVGYCHALRVYLKPKFGSYTTNRHDLRDHELIDDTIASDNDAGFELPPMKPWDNSPSPPWDEKDAEKDDRSVGPILTFAIPSQDPLSHSSRVDNKESFQIHKCPPLLWKVEHPPNPNVAIDSFCLMEGKLNLNHHEGAIATVQNPSQSADKPTNIYINGYQSWSFSGSVEKGQPQPKSAMPNVVSEAFNRGGVVLSPSSRNSVVIEAEDGDFWLENITSSTHIVRENGGKYSCNFEQEEDLNEENAFYKSDMFTCISSNGTNCHRISDGRVLLDEEGGPALIVGFLAQRHQYGVILIDRDLQRYNLSACHEGVVASPSSNSSSHFNGRNSLSSDWAFCQIVDSSCYDEEAMVYYIHASADHNDARPMEKGLTTGWCSWYHYYSDIDHDSLSKNADILEQHQNNIGFNVCLIDDGYMASWGDWNSLKPGRFMKDGGMKVLANTIKAKGMKPGIWLAPFACDKGSKLAKGHPDWIIRNDKGRVANSAHCGKYFYGLDATNPAVRKHVYDTIRRAVKDWGFEVLKLDFLYACCLSGNGKYDNTMSRAEAMYLGFRTIRAAAGDAFIIGCGSPLGSAIGFVDGMRVSCDTGPTWYPAFPLPWWDNGTLPALRGMLRNTLSRAVLGHRWWHNDPDCILLGESTKLTDVEVVSAASIVAMTGGMFLLSDDMEKVSESRLSVAKKIFPLTGVTAVPLDLHSTQNGGMPSILRAWCSDESTVINAQQKEVRKTEGLPSSWSSDMLREQASKLECEVGYSPGMIMNPYSRERSCFAVAPGLGTWTVVSLSNWMDHSNKLSVSFSALIWHSYQDYLSTGTPTSKEITGDTIERVFDTPGEQTESGFHVFSFWESKYSWVPHQALVGNDPLVKKLAPHETEIFHIKPANPTRPQYIGSDLHFSCGFEVQNFEWSERSVKIELKNEYEKKGSIFVYLPGGRGDGEKKLENLSITVNGTVTPDWCVIAKPKIGVHSAGSPKPTHYYHGNIVKVQVSVAGSSGDGDGIVHFNF